MNSYVLANCKPWNLGVGKSLLEFDNGFYEWVSTPEQLVEAVARLNPRYCFFLHWNWHVPREIWSRYECVCFHMTDVPYGRGGSPLQNLIVAGHKSTRLSALRMVEEMDAGPVYAKREMSLEGRAEEIYIRAGELSFEIIQWMIGNEPAAVPQQGPVVTFRRRKPWQSVLPEDGSLRMVYDHIRMLDAPTYPLAFVEHGNFRLEFLNARLLDEEVVAKVVIRKKPLK